MDTSRLPTDRRDTSGQHAAYTGRLAGVDSHPLDQLLSPAEQAAALERLRPCVAGETDTAHPPLGRELYDPTAPPPPRTCLLDARGHQLRRFHRAERVRVTRLTEDGEPSGPSWSADTATWVTCGEALEDTSPSPCVDLTLPSREVSVELTLQPWAYWLFTDPGLPERIWTRR